MFAVNIYIIIIVKLISLTWQYLEETSDVAVRQQLHLFYANTTHVIRFNVFFRYIYRIKRSFSDFSSITKCSNLVRHAILLAHILFHVN